MKQCWRCRSTISENMVHHVNGNHLDQKPQNLLRLCLKCHDLMQAICDNCDNQSACYIQKLQRCWGFEKALPPIYYIPKEIESRQMVNQKEKWHRRPLESETATLDTVRCEICGKNYVWRLSEGKTSMICPMCVLLACGGFVRIKRNNEISG